MLVIMFLTHVFLALVLGATPTTYPSNTGVALRKSNLIRDVYFDRSLFHLQSTSGKFLGFSIHAKDISFLNGVFAQIEGTSNNSIVFFYLPIRYFIQNIYFTLMSKSIMSHNKQKKNQWMSHCYHNVSSTFLSHVT